MARRPYAVFLIPLTLLVLVLGACGSQDANTSAPAGAPDQSGGQATAGM